MKKETMYMIGAGVVGFLAIRWYLKSRNESTSSIGGVQIGTQACGSPDNNVCSNACSNLGGQYNTSDRKCYKNGAPITGGIFGTGLRAVKKTYSSACGCGA